MKGFEPTAVDGERINPSRTVVLAIHWQEDVVNPKTTFGAIFGETVARSGIIPRTAGLLQSAREAGCLIIYVNIVYRPGYSGIVENNALFRKAVESKGFIVGTPGVDVVAALRPEPQDIVMDHSRSSAFFGSDLLTILIGRGIETIALTGIATNVAVDHTARDAMQYGFRTIFVEDCCISSDPEHHRAALITMRVLCSAVVTSQDFTALLQRRGEVAEAPHEGKKE